MDSKLKSATRLRLVKVSHLFELYNLATIQKILIALGTELVFGRTYRLVTIWILLAEMFSPTGEIQKPIYKCSQLNK